MFDLLQLRNEIFLALTIRVVVRLFFAMDFESLVFHERIDIVLV